MKNTLVGLASVLLIAGMIGTASASMVDFDVDGSGSSVQLSEVSTWGWTSLTANLVSGLDSTIFSLDDGQTKEIDFFTLTAKGIGLGSASIAATLAFEAPPISANGTGKAKWGTILGIISGGMLNWDDTTLPDYLTLDNGNQIKIDFEDGVALVCGNTATVHAYITNNGGAAPVPEPATIILFGTGLAGIAGARARRKTK